MPKPEVLQIGPYPAWDQEPLDAAFTMHRLFEAADKAGISEDSRRQPSGHRHARRIGRQP